MRLLRTGLDQPGHEKLELIEEFGLDIPDYAILSHTWGDDEVLYQHICDGTSHLHQAYSKVISAMRQAASDGLAYVWIDTCCIDISSSAELIEALNSMYAWYSGAQVCYALLDDVPDIGSREFTLRFHGGRWFTRGWTLQELLAPIHIEFYGQGQDRKWTPLGDIHALQAQISKITSIEVAYLTGLEDVHDASIAKRMSWAARRKTKREEDLAYCLLGLFSINMPMLYGEGPRAFLRLQEDIIKHSDDQSIFAWRRGHGNEEFHHVATQNEPTTTTSKMDTTAMTKHGLLADSPASFAQSRHFVPCRVPRKYTQRQTTFRMSNRGLEINLPVHWNAMQDAHIALLECRDERRSDNQFLGVYLKRVERGSSQYTRVKCDAWVEGLPAPTLSSWRDVFLRQTLEKQMANHVLLHHIHCRDDKYLTTRVVHLKLLPGRRTETKELYSREVDNKSSRTCAFPSAILQVRNARNAHGRLLETHCAMISLARQSDRRRLLVLVGIHGNFESTFAINPASLDRVDTVDLTLTHLSSVTNARSFLKATTDDGDHITSTVQTTVEGRRRTTAIDLHIMPCDGVYANHSEFHLPRTDVEWIKLWDADADTLLLKPTSNPKVFEPAPLSRAQRLVT